MRGRIEFVTQEGVVEGWCWNEDEPHLSVQLTVLSDGVAVASGVAGRFREDLLKAGIGKGFHGFSIVLPRDERRRTQVITAIATSTKVLIGEPCVFQNKSVANLDDRIEELEAKSRLLDSRIAELTHHARYGTAPADLFAVVGTFFTQLAQDLQSGSPPDVHQRLESAIRTRIKAHPVVTLPRPARPSMTVVIEATAPLGQLYETVSALQRAGVGEIADVVVLDPGAADDVALIPSVVRGLSYVRVATGTVSEWNQVEQASQSDIVVLLSGRASIAPDWLSEIAASFAANPSLGAAGGGVLDVDGRFVHGGLVLDDSGELVDCVAGRSLSEPDVAVLQPVHALSHRVMAVRQVALREFGGLDEAYGDDLGAAVLDLCFRLRQSGWTVAFQPFATAALQPTYTGETWVMSLSGSSSPSADLLRARFDLQGARDPLEAGSAAIVVVDDAWSDILAIVQHLNRAGYAATCVSRRHVAADMERKLRRSGATVVQCETDDAVGEAVALCRADLIYAAGGQGATALLKKSAGPGQVVAGLAALQQAIDRRERQASVPR